MKDKAFWSKNTFAIQGKEFNTPIVMGILNVTPDSFYDGGNFLVEEAIETQAKKMIAEGATIIDVGGYSSRPNAVDVPVEVEMDRVTNAIKCIRSFDKEILISVDTFRASIAEKAMKVGATIINDISGGQLDAQMYPLVAEAQIPYIMMHMRGTPQTMPSLTDYKDVTKEVITFFKQKIEALTALGIHQLIVDPGFGFAKTVEQNYTLLNALETLDELQLPLLVGVSRKSMIYKKLGITAAESLNGTSILNTVALLKGASILRVHDVKSAVEAVKLVNSLQ